MAFPTTVDEALTLTPEQAEDILETLLETLDATMSETDLPDDFEDREPNFMLASVIDTLNRIAQLPSQPLGPGGWVAMLAEVENESEEDSGSSFNS